MVSNQDFDGMVYFFSGWMVSNLDSKPDMSGLFRAVPTRGPLDPRYTQVGFNLISDQVCKGGG